MTSHILSILAFMIVSFTAQGFSHFLINKAHFDAIEFMRPDPIIPLGLFVMVVQGALMSVALQAWKGEAARISDGVWIALFFGGFLVTYIALVEPSKYIVPSLIGWVRVEAIVGTAQFLAFGVLLGWIHQRF